MRNIILGFCLFSISAIGQNNNAGLLKHYLFNDNIDSVLILTDSLLAIDSLNHELHYYKALAHKENYQFEKAYNSINKAIDVDASSIDYQKLKAKVSISLNNIPEAINIYESIYATDSTSVPTKIQLGRLYQKTNEYNKAIPIYFDLVEKDTLNSYYNKQLGMCFYYSKQVQEALFFFQRALIANPKDVNLAVIIANTYNDFHNYMMSLQFLIVALDAKPDNAKLLKIMAYTQFLLRDNKKAINNFNKTLQQGDSSVFVYRYLGYSYYNDEDFENAYDILTLASEKDTANSKIFFHLSISARKLYKTDESIAYMDKAYKLLFPGNNVLSLYLMQMAENAIVHGSRQKIYGNLVEEEKYYLKAIDYLKQSYDKDTSNTYAIFQIASTYEKYLDDKTRALAFYLDFMRIINFDKAELDEGQVHRYEFVKDRIKRIKEELHFDDELNGED